MPRDLRSRSSKKTRDLILFRRNTAPRIPKACEPNFLFHISRKFAHYAYYTDQAKSAMSFNQKLREKNHYIPTSNWRFSRLAAPKPKPNAANSRPLRTGFPPHFSSAATTIRQSPLQIPIFAHKHAGFHWHVANGGENGVSLRMRTPARACLFAVLILFAGCGGYISPCPHMKNACPMHQNTWKMCVAAVITAATE